MIEFFKKYIDVNTAKLIATAIISIVFAIYITNKKSLVVYYGEPVNFKFETLCLDSLQDEKYDLGSFIPKKIKYLAIHCSGSPEGKDYTIFQIKDWFVQRGWSKPGYQKIIHLNGETDILQPLNDDNLIQYNELVNGVQGYNSSTISICYIGGVDIFGNPKDTRTYPQKRVLEFWIKYYKEKYPWIIVQGHTDFPNVLKACPSFKVK